jgi:hypothetical protein
MPITADEAQTRAQIFDKQILQRTIAELEWDIKEFREGTFLEDSYANRRSSRQPEFFGGDGFGWYPPWMPPFGGGGYGSPTMPGIPPMQQSPGGGYPFAPAQMPQTGGWPQPPMPPFPRGWFLPGGGGGLLDI